MHIGLFLISCDSGGMSLGDSEINYDFFWQNWFLIELLLLMWCFIYWIVFPILKDALLDAIFILFPAGFVISPVRNLLVGRTPEKFLKFEIFPVEPSSPHRSTDTGCHYRSINLKSGSKNIWVIYWWYSCAI